MLSLVRWNLHGSDLFVRYIPPIHWTEVCEIWGTNQYLKLIADLLKHPRAIIAL